METPLPQRQLPDGTLLQNGKYRIVRQLGQGGFGITYLAWHQVFGDVAIKELFLNSGVAHCSRESTTQRRVVPHFDAVQFQAYKTRFLREAQTLFALRDIHGVVKVLDIFEENDTVYFSMEYLHGEKLEDFIKQRPTLDENEGLQIINALGQTLEAVHRHGVLHRDVKPTNVIMTKDLRPYLIDFGIARSFIDEVLETHTTFHSLRYSPPEQKISQAPLGTYSDVYALGATAYFVFTGIPPQSVEERTTGDYHPPKHYAPMLPAHIDETITKSLKLRPDERFRTISEFLEALRNGKTAPPPGPKPSADEEKTIIEPAPRASAPVIPNDEGKTIIEPTPQASTPAMPIDEGKTIIESPQAPPVAPKKRPDQKDESTQILSDAKHKVNSDPEKTQITPPEKTLSDDKKRMRLILAGICISAIVGITSYWVWMSNSSVEARQPTDPGSTNRDTSAIVENSDPANVKSVLSFNTIDSLVLRNLFGRWQSKGMRDFFFESPRTAVHIGNNYFVRWDSLGELSAIMRLEPFDDKLPDKFRIRVQYPLQREQMQLEVIEYKGKKYPNGQNPVFTRARKK